MNKQPAGGGGAVQSHEGKPVDLDQQSAQHSAGKQEQQPAAKGSAAVEVLTSPPAESHIECRGGVCGAAGASGGYGSADTM